MSDDLIERLRVRADTMNGASHVGAGDGNTYACGYYGMIDRKLDRDILDALAAKDAALSEMRAELDTLRDNFAQLGELQKMAFLRATAAEAQLEQVKKALEPFSRKERWFKAYHRPEVPGPVLPVVFFSDNPWESNDLEPWVPAARALAPSIQDEGGER